MNGSLFLPLGAAALLALPAPAAIQDDPELRARRVTPIVELVRRVGPTVVNLYSNIEYVGRGGLFGQPYRAEAGSLGSGVIVHPSGIVVTNAHVITANLGSVSEVDISVSYRPDWSGGPGSDRMNQYKATLLGFSSEEDLAVLKIQSDEQFPAAVLGTSSDLMVGETVVAVGNPFGREGSVTHGIISATNRKLAGPEGDEYSDLIQTDTPLNAGNSGGPLFNILGELIGINQAIGADARLGRAEGQGLAIPVDRVRQLLEALSPYTLGRCYFGIEISSDPSGGVRVERVDPGGPAARAGLEVGDRLLQVGPYEVSDRLSFNLSLFPLVEDPSVTFSGKRRDRDVEVAVRPVSVLDTVHSTLGMELVVDRDYPGPVVRRVDPDGPAFETGIQKGDVVTSLGDQPIHSYLDVFQVILNAQDRDLPIQIRRYNPGSARRYTPYTGTIRLAVQ